MNVAALLYSDSNNFTCLNPTISLICRTPLHAAAFNDQVECLQLLLSRGGDIDAVDYMDKTPLMIAAENGHSGAVGMCDQYTLNSCLLLLVVVFLRPEN